MSKRQQRRRNNNRDRNVLKQKGECATDAVTVVVVVVAAASAAKASIHICEQPINTYDIHKKRADLHTCVSMHIAYMYVLVRLQSIDHPYPGSVTDDGSDEETLKMESKK